jgi:hypothetical protein
LKTPPIQPGGVSFLKPLKRLLTSGVRLHPPGAYARLDFVKVVQNLAAYSIKRKAFAEQSILLKGAPFPSRDLLDHDFGAEPASGRTRILCPDGHHCFSFEKLS